MAVWVGVGVWGYLSYYPDQRSGTRSTVLNVPISHLIRSSSCYSGLRPQRAEPSGQVAEHCVETLRDEEKPAQTRLHKPPRQDRLNPGGKHKDP
jgi:hypothetical protein